MKMHRKAKNRRYEFQIFFRVFRPYEALFERNDWRDLIFEVRNKNILKEHGYFLEWLGEFPGRKREARESAKLAMLRSFEEIRAGASPRVRLEADL